MYTDKCPLCGSFVPYDMEGHIEQCASHAQHKIKIEKEDRVLSPKDWIIHCGPASNGDYSMSRTAVQLVSISANHLVVYLPTFERKIILPKEQYPNFSVASEEIIVATKEQAALDRAGFQQTEQGHGEKETQV